MIIIAGVLTIGGLIGLVWSVFAFTRWLLRLAAEPPPTGPQRVRLPPYGGLPGLGPVGPLGGLSPDAEINGSLSSHDLYGS